MFPQRRSPIALVAVFCALAFAATGCAEEARPPRAPAPRDAGIDGLLAHITANDPRLADAAIAIARNGDVAARRDAAARLVAAAQALLSTPSRDATYRNERLGAVLRGMLAIGGAGVVAYCFGLAEDESAPLELRQAALDVLLQHVDRRDAAAAARGAALWDRLMVLRAVATPNATATSGGSVTNASAVVASMAPAFRRCYNHALQKDPNTRGSARITGKIGAQGEVLSVSPSSSGLSADTVACISAVVASARFSPPEGGGATIVIPVTFVSHD